MGLDLNEIINNNHSLLLDSLIYRNLCSIWLISNRLPKECIDNLKENLKTLKVVYKDIEKPLANYNVEENTIYVSKKLASLANDKKHSLTVDNAVLHELIHVASTKKIDKKITGFNSLEGPFKPCYYNNVGLTEGYTDYLLKEYSSYLGYTLNPGYKELSDIAALLTVFASKKYTDETYFTNKGTIYLVPVLKYNCDIDASIYEELLTNIELYYNYSYNSRNINSRLASINDTFNRMLKSYIKFKKENDSSIEDINNLINNYEKNRLSLELLGNYGLENLNDREYNKTLKDYDKIKRKALTKRFRLF